MRACENLKSRHIGFGRYSTTLFLLSLLVLSCPTPAKVTNAKSRPSSEEAKKIRAHVDYLSMNGRNDDILVYLQGVEGKYGDLAIDDQLPSLYNYRGVSQHNAQVL